MKRKRSTAPKPAAKRFQPAPRLPVGYRTMELKNIDQLDTAGIVAAQTTSTRILFNGIDDGVLSTQRVGRRIMMKNLHIRWNGSFAATTAGTSPLRLVVVYDKQSNAAAPAATDVFQVDQISTEMNLGNARRFKVLVDEQVECMGLAGPAAFNRVIWRDFIAKGTLPGLAVEFNDASTATITSITTGSMYGFVFQNGNIITANPTQALYSRIRFSDA